MTGQELYEIYVETQLRLNNCEVESWEDLDPSEQAVWVEVARECRARE